MSIMSKVKQLSVHEDVYGDLHPAMDVFCSAYPESELTERYVNVAELIQVLESHNIDPTIILEKVK